MRKTSIVSSALLCALLTACAVKHPSVVQRDMAIDNMHRFWRLSSDVKCYDALRSEGSHVRQIAGWLPVSGETPPAVLRAWTGTIPATLVRGDLLLASRSCPYTLHLVVFGNDTQGDVCRLIIRACDGFKMLDTVRYPGPPPPPGDAFGQLLRKAMKRAYEQLRAEHVRIPLAVI